MKNKFQAVICAAGEGSRLRPLTDHCPKPLIKVGNKTILEYQLDNISALGIKEVIIVVGYKAETIIKKIGDQYKGCQYRFYLICPYYFCYRLCYFYCLYKY